MSWPCTASATSLKTTGYHLHKRSHGLKLSAVQSSFFRKNFIYRMLYTDIYWIFLFYDTGYFFEYAIYFFSIIFVFLHLYFNIERLRVSMFVSKDTTYLLNCVDFCLWQTVPAVNRPLWEKVWITSTSFLQQLPIVSHCNAVFNTNKEVRPRHHHFVVLW